MQTDIPIIIYTHSSYKDVFDISIKRYEKYAKNYKKIIISDYLMDLNSKIIPLDNSYQSILYENIDVYSKRLYNTLKQIENNHEYIIFTHENNTLFDFINTELIIKNVDYMREYNIDQLRLYKGGVDENCNYIKICENIYEIPTQNSYIYTVQPTIWKLSTLIKIMNENNYDYRNIELNIDPYMLQYKNCFFYNNEDTFIGTSRCKSSIFPIIHTTCNGLWLYHENRNYIDDLFSEYNIDPNIRGII